MNNGNSHRVIPTVVVLSGLPGAGKTTFVRALRARITCDHVESDAIRRGLAAKPTYSAEESGRVFAIARERAAEGMRAGRTVVIDATNLRRRDRKQFVTLAERAGARLVAVRVTAPGTTLHERLSRPRDGFSQADGKVLDLMNGRGQRFDGEQVVVDTRFDTRPSVELVAALVEAGE
jgi:predicted kinase